MNNYSLTEGGACRNINIRFISIILLILFAVACNDSFEPLKENNCYFFSMYGYLDASADTQWVRIAPAREQLEMAPVKPDMRVTLEDTESGEQTFCCL